MIIRPILYVLLFPQGNIFINRRKTTHDNNLMSDPAEGGAVDAYSETGR